MMLDQLIDGTLISASIDTFTILWDVSTGNPLNKFKPLSTTNGPVTCLKQLPSGYIVFAGNDSSLYTWNVTGNNTPSLFATTSSHMLQPPCQAIVLYSDSSLVYSSKGIDTDIMIVDGLSQLNYNKSFTLTDGTWTTCLENQGIFNLINNLCQILFKIVNFIKIFSAVVLIINLNVSEKLNLVHRLESIYIL